MILIRRDKFSRSPWIAAGTVVGALGGAIAGFSITAIDGNANDRLAGSVLTLLCALLGLFAGVILDWRARHKERQIGRRKAELSSAPKTSTSRIVIPSFGLLYAAMIAFLMYANEHGVRLSPWVYELTIAISVLFLAASIFLASKVF